MEIHGVARHGVRIRPDEPAASGLKGLILVVERRA
jgi:hypothetical protein